MDYYRKYHYRGDKCSDCSKEITIKNKSGKCSSCRMKGNTRGAGMVITQNHRQSISIANSGDKNVNWKGDSVAYNALHRWVEKRFKKPKLCGICKKEKPFDLANKGTYNRDLKNWEWLCRRCHMRSDGRLKELLKRNAIKKSFSVKS